MPPPPASKDFAKPEHPIADEKEITEQVASQLRSLSISPAEDANVGLHDDGQKPPSSSSEELLAEHDGASPKHVQIFLGEGKEHATALTTGTATSSPKPQGAPAASGDRTHRPGGRRPSRKGTSSTSQGVDEATREQIKKVHCAKRLRYTAKDDGSLEFAFTFYNDKDEMICAEVDGVHEWMPPRGSTALEAFPRITLFAIGKPFQNQGYGRACLLMLEEFTRAEGHRQIYVRTPGKNASGFYAACGYQNCGGNDGGPWMFKRLDGGLGELAAPNHEERSSSCLPMGGG